MAAMALLPAFSRRTLSLVRRPVEGDARAVCEAASRRISARVAPPSIDGDALLEARLLASTSGHTPSARAAFARANALVAAALTEGRTVDMALVRELDAAVLGRPGAAAFRRTATTIDGFACPPPGAIVGMLTPLPAALEERAREVHPIAAAALAYQWLVTVHPFDDGNGRTARLVTDLLLARAGLPPACIAGGADHVAVRDENASFVTPRFAIDVVLRGLEATERLLWP